MKYIPKPLFYIVLFLILFWGCVISVFACENEDPDKVFLDSIQKECEQTALCGEKR